MLVALPGGAEPARARGRPPAAVPARTLVLSHALTLAPDPNAGHATPVAHAELAAVAADLRRDIPYPPGLEDRFDWAATPPGPYDMASINHREEVQMLLEFRAGCLWLRYWLSADAGGPGGGRDRARGRPERGRTGGSPATARAGREIAAAAARGDARGARRGPARRLLGRVSQPRSGART